MAPEAGVDSTRPTCSIHNQEPQEPRKHQDPQEHLHQHARACCRARPSCSPPSWAAWMVQWPARPKKRSRRTLRSVETWRSCNYPMAPWTTSPPFRPSLLASRRALQPSFGPTDPKSCSSLFLRAGFVLDASNGEPAVFYDFFAAPQQGPGGPGRGPRRGPSKDCVNTPRFSALVRRPAWRPAWRQLPAFSVNRGGG